MNDVTPSGAPWGEEAAILRAFPKALNPSAAPVVQEAVSKSQQMIDMQGERAQGGSSASVGVFLGRPRFDAAVPTVASLPAVWRNRFAERGARAADGVEGDFAVGLVAEDGRVFLAVDKFAVRSLCYRQVGDRLLFAERADALADADSEIDPQAVFDYLYFHVIPSPRTIFKGVFRLPPGHYALFEKGRLTVAPYWQPHFEEVARADFGVLRDEFRTLLHQAVAAQLDGSKAACFLSGGTDSSTVAGMIGEVAGRPAATYSIGFEAEGYDEMEFARITARHFRTEHHEYYVTPADLVRSIPAVAAHYDQPFGNSSALPAYYCARMAREDGVSRLLAGDGGDELFGGNTRYAKQRVFNLYRHFPALMRRGVMEPLLATSLAGRVPVVKKAASYVEQAKVPMPDRLQMYNLIMRLGVGDVLTPELLARIDLQSPLHQQQAVWRAAGACSAVNQQLAFDWRYTLAENDLPKVVGTTGLAGVDVGFPLLDDHLLDFSLKLPSEYKLKGLKLRWFFKEALRGFLPDETLVKKKQGFGLPFGVWVTRHADLRGMAADSLHGLVSRGILRADFVDALLTKHLFEHPGYFGEMIWISMMLQQWLAAWDARKGAAKAVGAS